MRHSKPSLLIQGEPKTPYKPSCEECDGIPAKVSAEFLAEFTGLEVSQRWFRELASQGHFPSPVRNRYDFKATVAGLIRHYRSMKSELATVKQAIADEEHRKKKRENDLADELLVPRAAVVAEFRKVSDPIKNLLRQKLENEYPLAVAGLDIPQARIYGKRLEDDILAEFQKIFLQFKE